MKLLVLFLFIYFIFGKMYQNYIFVHPWYTSVYLAAYQKLWKKNKIILYVYKCCFLYVLQFIVAIFFFINICYCCLLCYFFIFRYIFFKCPFKHVLYVRMYSKYCKHSSMYSKFQYLGLSPVFYDNSEYNRWIYNK